MPSDFLSFGIDVLSWWTTLDVSWLLTLDNRSMTLVLQRRKKIRIEHAQMEQRPRKGKAAACMNILWDFTVTHCMMMVIPSAMAKSRLASIDQ